MAARSIVGDRKADWLDLPPRVDAALGG